MNIKNIYFLLLFIVLSQPIWSQQNKSVQSGAKVFIIGEEERRYEAIIQQYSLMLFQVCNNSMEEAYDYWNMLLQDMELKAQKMNIDIKGVKIWMNVFWNANGQIDYIVYHPKPNSKNMNYHELTTFFTQFISQYQLPLKANQKFSHYGSASFPIFNKSNLAQEK